MNAPRPECEKCVCFHCPRKAGCDFDGWPLADWCGRAKDHYCGDCRQENCEEAAQMTLF